MSESPPSGGHRRIRLLAAWGVAALLVLFLGYRFSAYAIRGCRIADHPVAVETLRELRIANRALFYPSHDESPRKLTVMTFNIEGHASFRDREHLGRIAETIRRVKPDVVGLQEVHQGTLQSHFEKQFDQLRRLTGMNGAFGRSVDLLGGNYGNAVLTRGRVVKESIYELPVIGEPRTVLDTTISIDGGSVHFMVTHLTAWGPLTRPIRRQQTACLERLLRSMDSPWILVGDLNAPPTSPELNILLRSAFVQMSPDWQIPTHPLTSERLDYILTDPGWTFSTAAVLAESASDHRPVVARIIGRRDSGRRGASS